jgi:hypothetical protein
MNTHATTEKLSFLCNGEVNTSVTIEQLLGNGIICWIRPEAEDSRPAELEFRKCLETAVENG